MIIALFISNKLILNYQLVKKKTNFDNKFEINYFIREFLSKTKLQKDSADAKNDTIIENVTEETRKCMDLQLQHRYGVDENGIMHTKRSRKRFCPVSGNYRLTKLLCCSKRQCRNWSPDCELI